jgi:hypothetical protein
MPMNPRLLRPLATGFNPRSIAGLSGWWDADDASTITLNSTTVSEWRDKSGNGQHLLQNTALNQPIYTVNAQNGRAVATFSSTFMKVDSVSLPQPFTVIAAYRQTATIQQRVLLSGNPSAGSTLNMMVVTNPSSLSGMNLGTAFFPISSTTTWQTQHHVGNGASSVVARNLDPDITGDAGLNGPLSLVLGSSASGNSGFFQGSLGELVIYNRALTRTEREQLVRYFANRWGITV